MTILDVRLTSHARDVSITEAAALLAVSRAHVARLIATGLLPHRMCGPRRRILMEDVLVYQHHRDAAHTVLDELARETDACGLYNKNGDASR
jgi:excisionase family DNA binding protein